MKRGLLFLLFLCTSIFLFAQEPVRFGDREVYLEANVRPQKRGQKTSSLALGIPMGESLNVLVQFERGTIPYAKLRQKGIELGDYLGNNAYYAQVAPGSRPSDFVGTGLRAVVPIRGEWKVVNGLLQQDIPEWVREGNNLKMSLSWFAGVRWEQIRTYLDAQGIVYHAASDVLRNVEISAPREALLSLAELECVAALRWIAPPAELQNREGARLSGARLLQIPLELGGRGLTGKGVRIGIWDANVADHADYGTRVHRQEFEISGTTHGMHTTGTIVGSGLLDERGKGMATEAEIWTNNFNTQSNGKSVALEMYESYLSQHITLTSNSYGYRMESLCGLDRYFNYTYIGNENVDRLSSWFPDMTHVFSAGNSQGACNKPFSHATNYAKNIISVAAVDALGEMTDFSSFGPLLDGRIFPIISARGKTVYSTVANQQYATMDGTSMACPMVTGHLALLTQRWMQLHGGAAPHNYLLKALVANTANDAGNPGPDYKYGFGILDAEAAIKAMESGWYKMGIFPQGGEAQTTTIQVPAGVQELRVMLCWSDPVATKEYATGECPLVNDLDLTLLGSGKTYLPFTLDPSNPSANATTSLPNKVDNIEQVVIKTPQAGEYTIRVAGLVRQETEQRYAVVWYFDEQKPEIVSPTVGDIYAPNEALYFRAKNLAGEVQVSLSVDGGKSYIQLGQYATCSSIKLPAEVLPTDKAMLRAIDENGVVVTMREHFAIMPQVQKLRLEDASCSTTGWKLIWEACTGAAKYEILRADVAQGSYQKVGEVVAPSTEFVIPPDAIVAGERNIYAVQAVSAEGVKGKRSVAVVSARVLPTILTMNDLPFLESFVGTPTSHTELISGENLKNQMKDVPVELQLPFMSHVAEWRVEKSATDWSAPFAQRENVATANVCALNLKKLEAGTKLQLSALVAMQSISEPSGILLRLLVNGEEVADVLDRSQISGDGYGHLLTWDLTKFAGQEIRLSLESALQEKGATLSLFYYRIFASTTQPDVRVGWVNNPEIAAKTNMKEEAITFSVANNSSVELKDVPVSVQVDGKVAYATTIAVLKSFEDRVFSVPYNFYSAEAHKFKVEVRAEVANDSNVENNAASFEVYNMGEALAMPELSYIDFLGAPFPSIPHITTKVKGAIAFVDGRGALEHYKAGEHAVLHVMPNDPRNALQVTFKEISLARADTLFVFTNDVPTDLYMVRRRDATTYITGAKKQSQVMLSEAADGGLTFYFYCGDGMPGEGWLAEVAEGALPNRWKAVRMEEIEGTDAVHRRLQIVAENALPVPQYNVGLWITRDGVRKRLEIPVLAPKGTQTTVLYPDEIDITAPMRTEFVAELERDGDLSDNQCEYVVQRDEIWNGGGTIKTPDALYVAQIYVAGTGDTLRLPAHKRITYMPSTKVQLYTQSKNALRFMLSAKPTAEQAGAKIRLWVDTNGDGMLQDQEPELTSVVLAEGVQEYWLTMDYASATGVVEGAHRMRVLLADDANYAAFKAGQEIAWGSVADFTAELKHAARPIECEVALLSLENVKSGRNLTATTPISVKLRNNGLTLLQKVKLSYQVDAGAVVTEELDCSIAPQGGEAVVNFSAPANLGNVGKYKLTVKLAQEDVYKQDNELETVLYHIAPKNTDKLFTLNFKGDVAEEIQLPEVAEAIDDKVTLEGWWKLDDARGAQYVRGDAIVLLSVVGNRYLPDNTLALVLGRQCEFTSAQPVVKPGQWQHIAITLSKAYGQTTMKAWVDGESVEMKRNGMAAFSLRGLSLNSPLKGANAMFRVWNTLRTEAEIQTHSQRSVRDGSGVLPPECVGEYIFTEGTGLASAYTDDKLAIIASERSNVWQPMTKVVTRVAAEGELIPAQYLEDDMVLLTMPQSFADFAHVKLQFVRDWVGTKVFFNSAEITAEQTFDFTANAEHTLLFTAEKQDLFGVNLVQSLKVKVVNDLSDACSITKISLPKAKNPGLKDDVAILSPAEMLVLPAQEMSANALDAQHITVVVNEISPAAKLYVGETEMQVGADITLDLSSPKLLRVVAANQRDTKLYTVQLAVPQEIQWTQEKLTRQFTSESLQLDAVASSGLSVAYRSLDPSVATVDAQGRLVTTSVGKTKIVATQTGNTKYAAAQTIEREIEVTRAPLTIKMLDATMGMGDKLSEFAFTYEGLQFEDTEYLFQTVYEVKTPHGTTWDETMPPLALGEYQVVPKGYTEPYSFNNYMVTRTNGRLVVTAPAKAKAVTFTARDERGGLLEGVAVQCGTQTATTGAEGSVVFYLPQGEYTAQATKEGYTPAEQSFRVRGRALQFELRLLKRVHTLTYKTDEHGLLQGAATQTVADGQDGEMVVAVPADLRHRFKQWSDGLTAAARTEKAVHGNHEFTAEFEPLTCKVTYLVGKGGTKVAGTFEQVIHPGEDTEQVEVNAEEGYVFIGWSDGVKTLRRKDEKVTTDLVVEALFFKAHLLTWNEDFEMGEENLHYWNFETPEEGSGWLYFERSKLRIEPPLSGGYVLMIDPFYGDIIPSYNNCGVATPWLSVANRASGTNVTLTFVRYFNQFESTDEVKVQYCFEDENWLDAATVSAGIDGATETVVLTDAILGTHKYLRFRWGYSNTSFFGFFALDDVKVRYAPVPTDVTLRYIAGENGKIRKEGSEELFSTLELSTNAGTLGTKVVAVPDEGYVFERWSDDKTNEAERQDDAEVTVKALFKRAPKTMYTVGYKAKEHGTLSGITYQLVAAGEASLPVNAVADAGYKFSQWSDGSRMNPRVDIVSEDGKIYEAEFVETKPVYTLTYVAGENGEIAGVLQQEVEHGADGAEVEALPDDGYRFVQWSDGVKTPKRTERNVQESKTYMAHFEAIPTYTISLAKEGEGELILTGIEADKLNAVPEGTELTAVATPATGWKLKGLTAGDKNIAADGKFVVTANVEVKAVFEKTTAVEDAIFANVLVAPNPFIAQLRLVCNGATGRYDLLNAQGVVVRSGNMDGNEVMIETTDLTSGLYLLRLTATNGATKVVTVVKE